LLEVLVAFVVMGLVVGVLLQLFGSAMHGVALADEYSFAVQVAESRLATVGTEIPVGQGTVSGDEPSSPYHWEVNMEPVKLDAKLEKMPLPLNVFQVVVGVSWPSNGVTRKFQLTSLRFGKSK